MITLLCILTILLVGCTTVNVNNYSLGTSADTPKKHGNTRYSVSISNPFYADRKLLMPTAASTSMQHPAENAHHPEVLVVPASLTKRQYRITNKKGSSVTTIKYAQSVPQQSVITETTNAHERMPEQLVDKNSVSGIVAQANNKIRWVNIGVLLAVVYSFCVAIISNTTRYNILYYASVVFNALTQSMKSVIGIFR